MKIVELQIPVKFVPNISVNWWIIIGSENCLFPNRQQAIISMVAYFTDVYMNRLVLLVTWINFNPSMDK